MRRQFREIPWLLEGRKDAVADYSRAVDITTRGALQAMILPGVIALVTPIIVGVLLRRSGSRFHGGHNLPVCCWQRR